MFVIVAVFAVTAACSGELLPILPVARAAVPYLSGNLRLEQAAMALMLLNHQVNGFLRVLQVELVVVTSGHPLLLI